MPPRDHRRIAAPRLTAVARTAAPWLTALAGLLLTGCPTNDNRQERCYRDLDREACRSVCKAGEQQACGALEQLDAEHGDLAAQQRLCKQGDMFACSALAKRQTDPVARRKILEEACARPDIGGPACGELADLTPDLVEKRKILERGCAMSTGLLACGRLAEMDPDPAVRARNVATVCVAGLEDKCWRLIDLEPNVAARRALLLEACAQNASSCRTHPIEQALRAARVPAEPTPARSADAKSPAAPVNSR